MADQRSVEMLAFNFASRTFAYKRLAQGLSRSVSAFSSFMREYLDPVVKADQCAQYVDDIGFAANNATDLSRNIRAVFSCIRQAGLKLTIEKCHFGVRQFEFLGRTISPEGISPQARKIQNFLDKLRFTKSKKAIQRYLGFVNYNRNYIPRMAEKLHLFYKLLRTEMPIKITSEFKEIFDSVNRALSDACELALKQPIPGKQLVLMMGCQFQNCQLQFNFKIAHIAGSVNTAADFLSRLQLKVTEKMRLKTREDSQTTPIEVTTSSWDVADEKQFFFTQADNIDESEQQTLERKEQSRQCEAMGNKQGTFFLEDKCQRTYKYRRKQYVVLHEWNQGKCTNTSRAR